MENNKEDQNKRKDYRNLYGMTGRGGNFGWKIFIAFALIWILITYFFRQAEGNTIELSYSEFKKNVSNQNVNEITFRGNTISGKFKSPYQKTKDDEKSV